MKRQRDAEPDTWKDRAHREYVRRLHVLEADEPPAASMAIHYTVKVPAGLQLGFLLSYKPAENVELQIPSMRSPQYFR